jgi:hypothetical protein
MGAFALHAAGKTSTKAGTAAFLRRFEEQVDPDHVLAPEVRARRAEWARKSYMVGLALKASRARGRRTKNEPATVSETSAAGSAEVGHGHPTAAS